MKKMVWKRLVAGLGTAAILFGNVADVLPSVAYAAEESAGAEEAFGEESAEVFDETLSEESVAEALADDDEEPAEADDAYDEPEESLEETAEEEPEEESAEVFSEEDVQEPEGEEAAVDEIGPVTLTASVVDAFGNEIDGRYTEIALPSFRDTLTLDDPENPPYEKVRRRTGSIGPVPTYSPAYDFVQATVNGTIITSIYREAVENEDYDAYYYTVGDEMVRFESDALIVMEYASPEGVDVSWAYADGSLILRAQLANAGAIPDEASLVVTPVTRETAGYSYGAYVEALKESNGALYEENTLFYDIAFLMDGWEAEPTDGSVKLSIEFLQQQLSGQLQAAEGSEIVVTHLPILPEVRKGYMSTAAATGLSASDIAAEQVLTAAADTSSVGNDVLEFSVDSLSMIAITRVDRGAYNRANGLGGAVTVDATLVDEFGRELDEQYTHISLPAFDEILWLDDQAQAPVERVRTLKRRIGLITVWNNYSYVAATLNGENILGIKKQSLPEGGESFLYTTDGENWTALEADATVLFTYAPADAERTTFEYRDAYAQVTAVLETADAIPADAELVVTPIVAGDKGYNAYMEALNEEAEGSYSEENTLLYDIAFMVTDESGNAVEYQPAEGAVRITVSFLQNQLTDDIAAQTPQEVQVLHLPLSDEAKETAATTLEAEFTAADVQVETLDATVSVEGTEQISFTAENFSTYAVVCGGSNGKIAFSAPGSEEIHALLGDAWLYGITANTWEFNGEAETNFAVKRLTGLGDAALSGGQTGVSDKAKGSNHQYVLVGEVNGSTHIKERPATVTIPQDQAGKLTGSGTSVRYIYDTKSNIDSKVGAMISYVASESARLAGLDNVESYSNLPGGDSAGKLTIDLTSAGAGTFYINADAWQVTKDEWDWQTGKSTKKTVNPLRQALETTGGLTIKKNSNQTIVFNFDSTAVTIDKYVIVEDGQTHDSEYLCNNSTTTLPTIASIIFNAPNASSVSLKTAAAGVFLFPQATVDFSGVAGGWLVCDRAVSAAEWHFTNGSLPDREGEQALEATKTVDGGTPTADQVFTFTLYEKNGASYTQLQQKNNNGGAVSFDPITYKKEGTYTYKIEETDAGDYMPAVTAYYAQVVVSKSREGDTTVYTAGLPTYYTDEACTQIAQGGAAFNNETQTQPGILAIHKIVVNDFGSEIVRDGTSPVLQNVTFRVTSTEDGSSFEFTGATPGDNVQVAQLTYKGYDVTVTYGPYGNATWIVCGLPVGTYTVEEIADGVTFGPGEKKYPLLKRTTYYSVSDFEKGFKLDNDGTGKISRKSGIRSAAQAEDTGLVKQAATEDWSVQIVEAKPYSGKRNAAVVDEIAEMVHVANHYSIPEAQFEAKKELSGRAWNSTDAFTFRLEAGEATILKDGRQETIISPMPESDTVTVTDATEGHAAKFGTIVYSYKGTYRYTIREIVPENAIEDIVYDPQVYQVVVKVGETTDDIIKSYHMTFDEKYHPMVAVVLYNDDETAKQAVFTNTYVEKTEASVVKVWDDADDQDGKRPQSLTVNLLKNGAVAQSVTLSEANGWAATISGLAAYEADGTANVYTWAEDETGLPAGYTLSGFSAAGTVTTLTNSYTPGKTSATIVKVWEDADDQDGKRPESITVALMVKNGDGAPEQKQTVTLSEANSWTAMVSDLPLYTNKKNNTYFWEETDKNAVEALGYTVQGPVTNGTVSTITNRRDTETVSAAVKKIWEDSDNQDGLRPTRLTATLVGTVGGAEVHRQVVALNAANGFSETVEGLAKYKAGEEISYTWTEETIAGYTQESAALTERKDADGRVIGTLTTFTNRHENEQTEASVEKVWDDANDQDGKRPKKLTVTLKGTVEGAAEALVTRTVELNAANGWRATVDALDKYADGKEISYSWTESAVPEGYSLTAAKKSADGKVTTLTNSYTPGEVSATVVKVWDDADDQDGKRPESITVRLMAQNGEAGQKKLQQTVTLTEANGWTATVSELPEYTGGVKNLYAWEEDEAGLPAGYTLKGTATSGTVTTITNSHETEETEASVKKVWDDADDQDGKRPESLTMTLSNGQTVTLSAANNWSAKLAGLPKYENGAEIDYTWTEPAVAGYTLVTDASGREGTLTTFTNRHETEEVERTVIKVWDDADNQDGKRPAELAVALVGTVGAQQISSQEVTLTAARGWTETITALPKYHEGSEIDYRWVETSLPAGYSLKNVGEAGTVTTITNTYAPGKVGASVYKIWEDADDQDGKRPVKITVSLKKNDGETVYEGGEDDSEPVAVTRELNEGNGWSAAVAGLDEYTNQKLNVYYWDEENVPTGYTLTGRTAKTPDEADATHVVGYVTTLTNTHVTEETEASVKKVWDDADDQDGKRPESLTVTLTGGRTVVLDESNGWSASVTGLPKYADGKEIDYAWTEPDIEGYTLNTDKSGRVGTLTTFTNTHETEQIRVAVVKVWNDAEDQDGKRPEKLVVTLSTGTQVTLSEANGWSAAIEGLPKYANGREIVYSWSEELLPEGYSLTDATTEKDALKGEITTTLTNTYAPGTVSATVKKVWDDADNQDGARPFNIRVALKNSKGETVAKDNDGTALPASYELNADNNWTVTVGNLPAYTAKEANAYHWEELGLDALEALEYSFVEGESGTEVTRNDKGEAAGFFTTVTNHYTPKTTRAKIVKIWDDADDQDGIRPQGITVYLMNGDKVVRTETLSGDADTWSRTIEDLPLYTDGTRNVYSWAEDENGLPEGYALTSSETADERENGETVGTVTTLTNSHTTWETEASVKKIWDDADNQDGKRPAALTVVLKGDGEPVETVELSEENDWQATVTNLPKNKAGKEIDYQWFEDESGLPEGYSLLSRDVSGTVTAITNYYQPGKVSATVKKVWDDEEDYDGLRPEELIVTLMNGDTEVQDVALNAENGWEATVADLDEYTGGRLNSYSWKEKAVPEGYALTDTAVDGSITTFTNSHAAARVDAKVDKVWVADQDLMVEVQFDLYRSVAGGKKELVGSKTENLTSATGWFGVFEDLLKYDENHNEYTYEVVETPYAVTRDGQRVQLSFRSDIDPKDLSDEEKGFGVTNTQLIDIPVKKLWIGGEEDVDIRVGLSRRLPGGSTFETVRDAEGTPLTLTLNKGNSWQGVFRDLDKYASVDDAKAGKAIEYRIEELTEVPGYTGSVTGDPEAGYEITNTLETTELDVRKVWDDNDDQDGKRPASIVLNLLRNGAKAESVTVAPAENGSWSYHWSGLRKTDENGVAINWSVTEDAVGEYSTEIRTLEDGTVVVTNTYTPKKTSVTVSKAWDDLNDADGVRPDSIRVQLYRSTGGTKRKVGGSVTLRASENWIYTWQGLDMYANGEEIVYSVEETVPSGYELVGITGDQTSGFYIENRHEAHGAARLYKKDGYTGATLAGARFALYTAAGERVGREQTSGDDGLIEYSGLAFGSYYFEEVAAPSGYEMRSDRYYFVIDADHGVAEPVELEAYNDPAQVAIDGAKVWDDQGDADGIRPASIQVILYADGAEVDVRTVTADGNGYWTYDFGRRPKYNGNGREIVYTIAETTVEGYSGATETLVDADGNISFVITNTHTPSVPPTVTTDVPQTPETPPTTVRPGVLGVVRKPPVPTPTVNPSVLGARRAVQGATRTAKVLGARRAATGDEATMALWGTLSGTSLAGFWAWLLAAFKRRKSDRRRKNGKNG